MKLATDIHYASGKNWTDFQVPWSEWRSRSLEIRLLHLNLRTLGSPVSITVRIQMCECYMAEAYNLDGVPSSLTCYSALVGERTIAISVSVCVSVCLSASISPEALDWSSRSFFCVISCGRGSDLLWRRCDTLCTSGFVDDVTFGRNGPYGDAWKAEPLTYYH